MSIDFHCECGKEFHLNDEHANKMARCKKCKRVIRVPKQNKSDELQKAQVISAPEAKLVVFKCNNCGKKYAVKGEAGGRKVKCKKCSNIITIPHPKKDAQVTVSDIKDKQKISTKKSNIFLKILLILFIIVSISGIGYGIYYYIEHMPEKKLQKTDVLKETKDEENIEYEKQITEGLQKIQGLKAEKAKKIAEKDEAKIDVIEHKPETVINSDESSRLKEEKLDKKKITQIEKEKFQQNEKIKQEAQEKSIETLKKDRGQAAPTPKISKIKPEIIEIKARPRVKKEKEPKPVKDKKHVKKDTKKKNLIIAKKDMSINLKGYVSLRSKPRYLTDDNIRVLVQKYNFFDVRRNRGGFFANNFVDNRDGTITDRKTELMWQKSGSSDMMLWDSVDKYIQELNKKQFGGYNDWRLPTLEELLSLTEQRITRQGPYIASIFSQKQGICVSSDTCKYENRLIPWYTSFLRGVVNCTTYDVLINYYVRAVRDHKIRKN